jgi:hypothetical protein
MALLDEALRQKLAREMTHQRPIESQRPLADAWAGMNNLQRLGLLQVPIVSDVAGLLGDVQMYQEKPETRGLLNYALSGAGLLPFVPGVTRAADPAIAAATARTRPAEYLPFAKPLTGPSGARLVGYEWKWTPFEYVDARGEDVVKRVSDWDESLLNAETGRNVVHQFHIERDGKKEIVSAESAAKLLGLAGQEQLKPLKSMVSASKTLARQKMQLAETESALQRFMEERAAVEALEPPKLVSRGRVPDDPEWITPDATVYTMGDQQMSYRPSKWRQDDPAGEMLARWRSARLKERIGSSTDDYKLRSLIDDLTKRIKRQEAKLK